MKYTIPNWLLEFANTVAKLKIAKKILKPIYYQYKLYLEKKQLHYFHTNALDALCQFDKVMELNDLKYTLAFGTLLGAVREKGFIKHDIDIDVSMWIEDYSDDTVGILENTGFKLVHSFTIDDGVSGREETYEYNGVQIDIFYFYANNKSYPYCCDFLMCENTATFRDSMKKYGYVRPRRLELPMSKERIRVPFENINLYIPSNAEEILRFRYGNDYMIPNKKWTVRSYDNHIVEWKEKRGIYKDFH